MFWGGGLWWLSGFVGYESRSTTYTVPTGVVIDCDLKMGVLVCSGFEGPGSTPQVGEVWGQEASAATRRFCSSGDFGWLLMAALRIDWFDLRIEP